MSLVFGTPNPHSFSLRRVCHPSTVLLRLPHRNTTLLPTSDLMDFKILPSKMLASSPHSHHQDLHLNPPPPRTVADHRRQLLLSAAQLIARSDFSAAHRLISFLSDNSSPAGDSTDRLVHHFTKALSLRLHHHLRHPPPPPPPILDDTILLQKSYLSLNQVTPFIRFSHLTANQAILEAIDINIPSNHPQYIHILDFDIMHGVQWPPLMQAIADRYPLPTPPTLRITSTGTDLENLRRTGDRLSNFAHSLNLNFRFHPVLLPVVDNVDDLVYHLSAVVLNPNETLAVNCVLYLHRLLKQHTHCESLIIMLLKTIKKMKPKVVTLAEKDGNHNNPLFLPRFAEAVNYYTAVFDSLEATLPPTSRERMEVEEVWFGREIADVVGAEGERHERFRWWEVVMRSAGFSNFPVSGFAVAQAKLLLRLHYPSEGYNVEVLNDCFFLGWQNQRLFSVSAWH